MARSNRKDAGTTEPVSGTEEGGTASQGNTTRKSGGSTKNRRSGGSTSPAESVEGRSEIGAEEVELPELVSIEDEAEVTVPTPAAAPARAAAPRPKKKKKPAPKVSSAQEAMKQVSENLSQLIVAVSGIVSLRAGSHWAISAQEAQAVAEPASRIMARHNLIEKVAQSSDYVALAIAAGTIVVPRLIVHNNQKPQGVKVSVPKPTPLPERPADQGQRSTDDADSGQASVTLSAGTPSGDKANAKQFLTAIDPVGSY